MFECLDLKHWAPQKPFATLPQIQLHTVDDGFNPFRSLPVTFKTL